MGLHERPVKDQPISTIWMHIEVALQPGRERIDFKNDNKVLPSRQGRNDVILVTGEYVDELAIGSGAAYVDGFDQITLLEALKKQFYGENV